MYSRRMLASMVVAVLALGGLAFAQAGMRGGGPGAGQRPGRFGEPPDPARMRQMMMEGLRQQLQVGEEEWRVLGPRLERVTELSREVAMGRMRMMRGGAGPMGLGAMRRGREAEPPHRPRTGAPGRAWERDPETSAVARASDELEETLNNPQATPEQIRARLTALRQARERARQELERAREEVRQLVTQRQEAQLVLMGILD